MAYLTQAGVAIGLAQLAQYKFPRIGDHLTTIVLAVISINQVIGARHLQGGFEYRKGSQAVDNKIPSTDKLSGHNEALHSNTRQHLEAISTEDNGHVR